MYILLVIFAIIISTASIVTVIILLNILFLIITRIPAVNSPRKYHKQILEAVDVGNKNIYDLGCGDGTFLIEANKYNPKKIIGLEIAIWPYLVASLKTLKTPILIKYKSFFKEDISDADVIFIYLVKGILPRLSKKLQKELKKGTIIISIGSQFYCFKQIKKIPLNKAKKYYAHIYRV
jgi:hypothetical protein